MAQRGSPAAVPSQQKLNGSDMKREQAGAAQREAEPAFADADVDHHDPRQRRRRQQQQRSREDVIIVVSDSDTEDENDNQDNNAPSSSSQPASNVGRPSTTLPSTAPSSAPSSAATTPSTALAFNSQPLTSNRPPPQQQQSGAPQTQPSLQQPHVSAVASSPAPTSNATSADRPTALNQGNGHKRIAVQQSTSTSPNTTHRSSLTTSVAVDDMPPLIPPPHAPPQQPPPPSFASYPPALAVAPVATPYNTHTALMHHSTIAQQQPHTYTNPPLVSPTSNVQQPIPPPPPPVHPSLHTTYIHSPSSITSASTTTATSSSRHSHSPVPVPSLDTRLPSLFLQSLFPANVNSALSAYCFICQCALPTSPSSAADSSFCCPICRSWYHSKCAFTCPRHTCHVCKPSSGVSSSGAMHGSSGGGSELYHCLMCPRAFCFAHATAAAYGFSSMPTIAAMRALSPTLLSVLVGAVLRNGDSISWYGTLSASQVGVCRFCWSEMDDEDEWRQMQAKRRIRIMKEQ